MKKKLPVGVDLFDKLIERGYYYLDKTLFIKTLVETCGDVNLFTRPRRFGKTLNMSMLKAFFEIGSDPSLFDGLAISQEREICEAYQGKYPVIFLSLKGVEGNNFEEALGWMRIQISRECKRLEERNGNFACSEDDRELLDKYVKRTETDIELAASLEILARMLRQHYGRRVIVLLDEYDVPLDKANSCGYYDEMVRFLRGFLGEVFKTNPDLYFAVVTGCLRISKESIFTGINNLKIDTISDVRYDEYFGFTDADVKKLLSDYSLAEAFDDVKKWYDGYHFGNEDVYCPWDVISHCDRLLQVPGAKPELYWDNSSSNQLVRHLIDLADAADRKDLERLIAGDTLEKKLVMNLTYDDLDKKELLWSVLYQTGYLTLESGSRPVQRGTVRFVIPNREIREIFIEKIQDWFAEKIERGGEELSELYHALENGDAAVAENILNRQLWASISYYDSYEGFYHGFLLGLLKGKQDWMVLSNRESGNGRSDILIECADGVRGMIVEVKRAKTRDGLLSACDDALRQVMENSYAEALYEEGFAEVRVYGISFYRKSCRVRAVLLEDAGSR